MERYNKSMNISGSFHLESLHKHSDARLKKTDNISCTHTHYIRFPKTLFYFYNIRMCYLK